MAFVAPRTWRVLQHDFREANANCCRGSGRPLTVDLRGGTLRSHNNLKGSIVRFIVGEMPKNDEFNVEDFIEIVEPSKSTFQSIGAALSLILGLLFFALWQLSGVFQGVDLSVKIIFVFVATMLLAIPIHEIFHAIVYPLDDTENMVFGFWPDMAAFYAAYDGELTRDRWLVVYLAPFVLMSVLPLLLHWTFGIASSWLAMLSIINAAYASGDLIATYFICSQVPRDAYIQNNGWTTYWRVKEE